MIYFFGILGVVLIMLGFVLAMGVTMYTEKPKHLLWGLFIALGVASIMLCNKFELTATLENPDNITQYATINNIKGTSVELDEVSYDLNKEILTKSNVNITDFKIGDIVKFTYNKRVFGTGYLTGIEKLDSSK